MKRCKFCTSDAFGNHAVADYQNPDNPLRCITVDVYGGNLTIGFVLDGEMKTLQQRIEYCPICGRKYEEATHEDHA